MLSRRYVRPEFFTLIKKSWLYFLQLERSLIHSPPSHETNPAALAGLANAEISYHIILNLGGWQPALPALLETC